MYPREFRDEYGREVAMVFTDRYRDATTDWQRGRLWLEAGAGVLAEAPKEHGGLILHDLRFALRMISRNPGFAASVVLTLALGIGANTAIFQLINAVQLQRLPVANPGELVEVRIAGGNQGFGINPSRYGQVTRPVWKELREHQQAFAGAFAWVDRELRVGENADLRRARGISVSGEFFSVLGVRPWLGRLLEPADENRCPGSPAVVSHAYWRSELGGRDLSSDVRLRVDGDLHDVVGVTPPGFFGLAVGERFDIALPYCQEQGPQVFDAAVIGRLRPGWTIERASAHVGAISAGIFAATAPPGYSAQYTEQFKSFRLAAYPASTGVSRLRSEYDTSLTLLLAITGLVLLIACANLANLMLARAVARTREISVRLALGASRTRLLRQLFAESLVVAAIGAACGVGLAQLLSRALVQALTTGNTTPTLSLATDWRILLFTGAVALATCLVFGIAPALYGTRVQPAGAMAAGGRTTTGRGRVSTDRVMVVTQIAVSVVLLVAAFLFVGSFRNLTTFDPGVRQAGVIVGMFGFDQSGIAPERFHAFRHELLDQVKSVPGVRNAATTIHVPLIGGSWGHILDAGAREGWCYFTAVSPEYLATMDIRVIQGRDFSIRDTSTSPKVAIVNQTFVRMWAATGSPIGQTFRTRPEPGYPATVYEIVGVIPDTKYNSLRDETPPMAFAPDAQYPAGGPWAAVMIHADGDTAIAMTGIRNRIRQWHPEIAMEFEDFQTRIRDGLVRERLLAVLAGFFGVVAAVLAVVGLYGMISYSVARRQREIGIRAALGARRLQVIRMVMREAVALMSAGLAIGTVASLLAGESAATLLFGLTPREPRVVLGACLLLTMVTVIASFIPARRASRVDPLTALREE
jgi:predicted permease